jgi:hypothetical protein
MSEDYDKDESQLLSEIAEIEQKNKESLIKYRDVW